MSNQTAKSGDSCVQREFAGAGLRTGVAKDKLIFIIICSAAMAVAAVPLVHFFRGSPVKRLDVTWQCLDCNYEFNKKTDELPPIPCPKCGGQAVWVMYRECPACGKKVLYYRLRLTAEAQAQREAIQKQAKATGQPTGPMPFGGPMMMMPPMDMQYWVKQPDGSFGWTAWMTPGAPQATQIQSNLQCSECGVMLFPPSPRSGGSRN